MKLKVKIPVVPKVGYQEREINLDFSNLDIRDMLTEQEAIVVDFQNDHLIVYDHTGQNNYTEKDFNKHLDMNFHDLVPPDEYLSSKEKALLNVVKNAFALVGVRADYYYISWD